MHQAFLDHERVCCVLAEFNIYPEQPSFHLPWFVKLSLIGLGIRVVIWLCQQFSTEKAPVQTPASKPTARRAAPRQAAPLPLEPAAVAKDVLILKGDQQLGPYGLEEIRHRIATGIFELSDLAWYDGLAEWQPLRSIPGVLALGLPGAPLQPVPPGWSGEPLSANNDATATSATGVLVGGYLCAAVSLLFLPPVLGLAGIICGCIAIRRQQINQGVILLVVSCVCAAVGILVGAVTA